MLQTQEFYGGLRNSAGDLLFPGQVAGNPIPRIPFDFQAPNAFLFDTIRILGFQDPDYNWRDFDLDRDLPLIDARVGFVDAADPDLRAFEANGGSPSLRPHFAPGRRALSSLVALTRVKESDYRHLSLSGTAPWGARKQLPPNSALLLHIARR